MNYLQPEKLETALEQINSDNFTIAAGCTDLLPATDKNIISGNILDISKISSLKGISVDKEFRRIGSTTTWSEILNSNLPECYQMLRECSREIGSIQIQNSGTIGGNLCNASPAADSVPCLLSLNASVELTSINKKRVLPLGKFINGSRKTEIKKNEILTSILIPKNNEKGISNFLKIGARKYLIISITMIACRVEVNKNLIDSISLSIGSCSEVAKRITSIEGLLVGKKLENKTIENLDLNSMTELSPITDIRSDKKYREEASKVLIKQTLHNCLKKIKSE